MLRFWRRNYSVAHPDFEPHSVIKVISGTKPKVESKRKHEENAVSSYEDKNLETNGIKSNVNEMGIQMISKNLFQQIFKNIKPMTFDQELIDK